MDRKRLRQLAEREGIEDDSYSLDGGLPSERYVLEITEGGWNVYYSERGLRTAQRHFQTESEACEYLFEKLLADRTTRKDFRGRRPGYPSSLNPVGWLIKSAEAPDHEAAYRAYFRGWATYGERDGCAWVEINPSLRPADSEKLGRVLLAPTDRGVSLIATDTKWPLHVDLLTGPSHLYLAPEVAPDALKTRLRGILEGEI